MTATQPQTTSDSPSHFRSSARVIAAALLGLFAVLPLACGKTTGDASGETHFLMYCDRSCSDGYECVCGVCTKRCDSAAICAGGASATCAPRADQCAVAAAVCDVRCSDASECSGLGEGYRCEDTACRRGTAPRPDDQLKCAPGCVAVTGYPADVQRGCVDLERGAKVACVCGDAPAFGACRRRVADGSLWTFPSGDIADASAWASCDAAEAELTTTSCDFETCDAPVSSVCSREDTCTARGCGNTQYDENGCSRPSCASDAECSADQRCVRSYQDTSFCSYSKESVCNCGGPAIALEGAFCNDTATAGPRGEWSRFEVERVSGPCPPGQSCVSTWAVLPDASIETFKEGQPGQAALTQDELEQLRRWIDGPELRPAMQNGFACPSAVPDLGMTFRLTLPDATLEQPVTGCVLNAPPGTIAEQIYNLITKY